MAIIWTLDTCGYDNTNENCQIELDSEGNFLQFLRKCPAHSAVPDTQTGLTQVAEENSRGQGNALWQLLQNAPTAFYDVGTDGITRTFKKGINASWSWTGTVPNRILNVTVTGISPTANQKTAIQAAVDNRFGAGKVLITFA